MNCYSLQQNAFAACEEMRGSVPITNHVGPVIFPKPRQVGVLSNMPMRSLRWHLSQQAEGSDSKAGAELLDIILKKESYGEEQCTNQVASSPPYFSGPPPIRTVNPLIQDARFGDEKYSPVFEISSRSGFSSSSSASYKGGCAGMNFGLIPAAVRVEGFDCLNRDCQNSGITAIA